MVSLWSGRTQQYFSAKLFCSWSAPSYPVHETIPTQVQDLEFVERHEFPVIPFLHPVEVPLNGMMTLVYQPLLLLQYNLYCSIIQVINEEGLAQQPSSKHANSKWPPGGFCIPDPNPQSSKSQTVSSVSHCLLSNYLLLDLLVSPHAVLYGCY